ncbi:MAG: hypothetical protein AABW67_03795 [Nanoarchaeota archaeon]
MIEKLLPELIEGGLSALEDLSKQDPRNIIYPNESASIIYKHLRNLITKAKQERIDVSRIGANHIVLLDKYRIAV